MSDTLIHLNEAKTEQVLMSDALIHLNEAKTEQVLMSDALTHGTPISDSVNHNRS